MKYVLRFLIFCLFASFSGFSQGLELVKSYPEASSLTHFKHNAFGEMYTNEYGFTCGSTTFSGNQINKYDANKNCIWSVPIQDNYPQIIKLTTDNDGNLILVGKFGVMDICGVFK